MLDAIKAITLLVVALAVPTLLLVFRAEVRRLVGWLISFKRIQKTKDGFALTPEGAPEARILVADSREALAIAEIQSSEKLETPTNSDEVEPSDYWWKAAKEKRYADAAKLLQHEIDEQTDAAKKVSLRSVLGNIILEQDTALGIEYFEKLLIDHPTATDPFVWYAQSLSWKELPEKSLEVIARGLPVVSEPGKLLEIQSDVFLDIGQVDKAFEASLEGVRQNPEVVGNYVNLAHIESERKQFDEAKTWYKRALAVSNNRESLFAAYAEWLWKHDFNDEALLRYHSLVTQYPSNSAYRAMLGNTYLAKSLPDLALEAYLEADRLAEGRQAWILGNIGNVYANQKLYSRAEEYLRRALTIDPSSQYAHERLASTLKAKEEQVEKSIELLDAVRASALLPPPPVPGRDLALSLLPPISPPGETASS